MKTGIVLRREKTQGAPPDAGPRRLRRVGRLSPAPPRLRRVRSLERGARPEPHGGARDRRVPARRDARRRARARARVDPGVGRRACRQRAALPPRPPRAAAPLASSTRSRRSGSPAGSAGRGRHTHRRRTAMRARALVVVLVCFVGLLAPPVTAQEAEALKKEIEQLRKQLESVTERLRRLEAQPAPVTPPPAPSPTGPPAMAPPPPGVSLAELARPRQPFSLYQQRGAGQLLFDIGIAGDFVGNITQSNVEKAQGGTFAGQENRFFPREVELSLFGQIDPYAYAEVRIEAGEDQRGADTGVSLAEASVTRLTLPYGTQAKFGQVRNRFGYSNVIHEHDLPWIDRPNVLRNFLGAEGLKEKGVEVTIVPDLPFYL